MSGNPRILIFDTTLRDGEQTPGVALTPDDKLVIARQLDRLGVDIIEAGFPITSKGEVEAIRRIVSEGLSAKICALSRCAKGDIDAVLNCGVDYIHLFIATSDLHLKYKLKLTREEALSRAIEAIEYAKSHGLYIEFSAEDATRTDLDYLTSFYKSVVEAGVDKVNIPDTVGTATPSSIARIVSSVGGAIGSIPISIHCHDDFGLAAANSIAAVEAGARQVHVTVNGLGERAGNAALEEVAVTLKILYGYDIGIKLPLIYETSRFVSRITGVYVQPNKAIVGDNAFTHESGIHTHGVLTHPLTYEPIPPEVVGRRRRLVAGKHAGRHGIMEMLEEMDVKVSDEELKIIVEKVKDLGDKGKRVTDADLLAIARSVTGKVRSEERRVKLIELAVVTGSKVIPTASVKLEVDDKIYVAAETGVGPVDAALKTIEKILSPTVKARLKSFRLEAITGGSDALAEVVIAVEDDKGNTVSARAAHEDIVMASVEAMIEGINRLLSVRREG
ncbi:MAG: 2-isopropylmalate synthase [Candidatus Bathyarchaeia archaeon]